MPTALRREELLALVQRIFRAEGTELEAYADVRLFVANCKHPSGSDLIFWPDLVAEFAGREPTPEEIVELAMREGEHLARTDRG